MERKVDGPPGSTPMRFDRPLNPNSLGQSTPFQGQQGAVDLLGHQCYASHRVDLLSDLGRAQKPLGGSQDVETRCLTRIQRAFLAVHRDRALAPAAASPR
ncbi:hypothetical protein [Mycolicibacterium nivoides]|uniref:hypothetical protein n=1 Tax=Mycolicibacterium nivoides TaxID=2487344 RepID=UPI000F5BEECE|nr:hypothetical protein [Mycolicibacterium nivoides]